MSRIMVFLSAFAVTLALSTEARAEDWSQFVDTNQKPLTHVQGPSKADLAPPPRTAKKAVAAKPTKIAKVNARAKSKSRR